MAALAHMTDEDLKAIGIPMVNSLKLLTLICLFNFLFLLLVIFWLKIALGYLPGMKKRMRYIDLSVSLHHKEGFYSDFIVLCIPF